MTTAAATWRLISGEVITKYLIKCYCCCFSVKAEPSLYSVICEPRDLHKRVFTKAYSGLPKETRSVALC